MERQAACRRARAVSLLLSAWTMLLVVSPQVSAA
jgi:hypothetical protein